LQETSELVDQDFLNLVCLFDAQAYSDRIDGGLNVYTVYQRVYRKEPGKSSLRHTKFLVFIAADGDTGRTVNQVAWELRSGHWGPHGLRINSGEDLASISGTL